MVRWDSLVCVFAAVAGAVELDKVSKTKAPAHLPGAYIFEFENGRDTSSFRLQAAEQGTTRMELDYDLFKGVSVQFDDVESSEDLAAKLAALPAIKNMWPVKLYSRPDPQVKSTGSASARSVTTKRAINETAEDTFEPHVMTQVDKLRAKGITGEGIHIAVIDTGIDYDHPALGGCFGSGCLVTQGTDLVGDAYDGYNAVNPDDDPMDCQGHGTHVAGIIAAQENSMGFTGAAPGVTLGAYRVFGCDGEASNDVLIAAYNQAYQDGADIITASIGGASGWSEEPWSVAVSRIVEKGVPCTVSAGNSGDVGMFYASTAANGKKVTAIASYDNNNYMSLLNVSHYTVDNGTQVEFGATAGTPGAWDNVTLPLWAPDYDTTVANGGCDAYPDDTPDLSGYIVLVRRGTCTFVQKAQNAADKGAKYIMLYNNVGGTANFDVSSVSSIVAAGMVSADMGAKWISHLAAGSSVTIEMGDGSGGEFLDVSTNSVSGGSVSTFSSWGPTWEMDVKPQFGSPGRDILSTYPTKKGSYAVLDGTSMACPLAAAIVALVAQVRGTLDPTVIENLLAANANPQLFNDGSSFYEFLAPVPQGGAGIIQAYDAAYAKVLLSTSSLSFNDTDNLVQSLNFTLENTGDASVEFEISNVPTRTTYTLGADSIYPDVFPNEFVDAVATLSFSESKISLGAGEKVTLEVLPTPPEGVSTERLALWSGFIALNGSDGTSLSLPYQGLAGSLHNATVLGSEDTWISQSTDDSLNPVADGTSFTLPAPGTAANSTATLPALVWYLALGSAKLHGDIVSVSSSNSSSKSIGEPTGFPALWSPMGANTISWTGEMASGDFAPAGQYKIVFRALKIFGDEDKEEDWDTSETPAFSIKYSS